VTLVVDLAASLALKQPPASKWRLCWLCASCVSSPRAIVSPAQMPRAKWKGPFFDTFILTKILRVLENGKLPVPHSRSLCVLQR
jgi:hypothetical protein